MGVCNITGIGKKVSAGLFYKYSVSEVFPQFMKLPTGQDGTEYKKEIFRILWIAKQP